MAATSRGDMSGTTERTQLLETNNTSQSHPLTLPDSDHSSHQYVNVAENGNTNNRATSSGRAPEDVELTDESRSLLGDDDRAQHSANDAHII